MGIRRSAQASLPPQAASSGLGDALFTGTQQRVLGLLFGQPDSSFFATELIALAGIGRGAVQRELLRLEQSGLVTTHRVATQRHYQANPASPIFDELTSIVRKTIGLGDPLRQALAPVASAIDAAFVYGSIAKGTDTTRSDIDLMIISDSVSYADVFGVLNELSRTLGREINPTIHTRAELDKGLKARNSFMTRVMAQPKLWIIGSEHEFAA